MVYCTGEDGMQTVDEEQKKNIYLACLDTLERSRGGRRDSVVARPRYRGPPAAAFSSEISLTCLTYSKAEECEDAQITYSRVLR